MFYLSSLHLSLVSPQLIQTRLVILDAIKHSYEGGKNSISEK